MNELALFAGAGGSILAGELLGWRTIAAVERDAYCVATLLHRQQEGTLPAFPIWDDICTFDGRPFRGVVDVVTAGFPCQPFSSAARGRNTAADMWPEALRIILEVRPRYVMLENVTRKPINTAARDLLENGFLVRCARVSAACLAAPHRRARYWMVADSNGYGELRQPVNAEVAEPSFAAHGDWWENHRAELLGVDDGVAYRMDRLRALGNGWVPSVAALAWQTLTKRLPAPR